MRRRHAGQVLTASGVGCLLFCVLIALATAHAARVVIVLLYLGMIAHGVGAAVYMAARVRGGHKK